MNLPPLDLNTCLRRWYKVSAKPKACRSFWKMFDIVVEDETCEEDLQLVRNEEATRTANVSMGRNRKGILLAMHVCRD